MGTWTTCVKYLLCLFNFFFFLAGGAVLAIGIWLSVDKTSFVLLTKLSENKDLAQFNDPSVIEQGAYILIATGAVIFIIGFLGCCGAITESRLMLGLYGSLMLLVFLLYVVVAVLVSVYKRETENKLRGFLVSTLTNWYSSPNKPNTVTVAWDVTMIQLECCGANNYTDFLSAKKWMDDKPASTEMPEACCRQRRTSDNKYEPKYPSCITSPSAENSHYLIGCYHRIKQHIHVHVDLIIGIAIAVGSILLILTVISFCLWKTFDYKVEKF